MAKNKPSTVKVGKLTATYSRVNANNVVVRGPGTVVIEGVTETIFKRLETLIGVAVAARKRTASQGTPTNADMMRPSRPAKPAEVEFNTYVVTKPRFGKPTARISPVVRKLIPEEFQAIVWTEAVEVPLVD
jgi:hypothetical protein